MRTIEPITQQQIARYSQVLKEELDEISIAISDLRKEFSEQQDVPTEEGDLATLEMERSEIRNRIQRYVDRQKKIKLVLEEFDEEFGYCIACGDDMDHRRLDIDATFRRCIDCEEIHQRKSQQYARPVID